MRLGETKKVMSMQAERTIPGSEPELTEQAQSRALVTPTPAATPRKTRGTYYQAPFVAHLLAMTDQHPQTRERRRAGPEEAAAAYRTTVELTRFR